MEDTDSSNPSEKRRKTDSDEEEDLKISGVSTGPRYGGRSCLLYRPTAERGRCLLSLLMLALQDT